jgi:hypothetical protein
MHEIEAFDLLVLGGITHPPLLSIAQSHDAAAVITCIARESGLLTYCRDSDEVQMLASHVLRLAAERGRWLDVFEQALASAEEFHARRAYLFN